MRAFHLTLQSYKRTNVLTLFLSEFVFLASALFLAMAVAEEHPHVDALLDELLGGESSGEEFLGFTEEDFGSEPEGEPSFDPVDFPDLWQEVNYLESDDVPEWLPVFTRASGPHSDILIDGSLMNIFRLFFDRRARCSCSGVK